MKILLKRFLKWSFYIIALLVIILVLRFLLGIFLQETSLVNVSKDIRQKALKLHHDSILFDGHNDIPEPILHFGFDLGSNGDEPNDRSMWWPWMIFNWLPFSPTGDTIATHTDLARMKEGGVKAQFFSIWVGSGCSYSETEVPGYSKQRVLDMALAFRKQVQKHNKEMEMAYTLKDIMRILSEKKIAALFGLEGGHAIEHDISNIQQYYDLGIRYISLTHRCSHDWADSSNDKPVWNGLSAFGEKVVKEMNRVGMIIDLSHSSDETFWDVIKITKAPVIASHSCARAITDNPRNMTDDMIKAVANTDGIVMINFMTPYLDPEKSPEWKSATGWHWFWHPIHPQTAVSMVVDHIDHVVQVAGIDHVGIGSDFDGVPTAWLPEGLKDVGDFPNITIELVSRGYKDKDIRKILGGNMLRVIDKAQVAFH
jgi:membrane dipeptidase